MMKYSTGFYIFQIEDCFDFEIEDKDITFLCTFSKHVDGFDCYSFSYYLTNQYFLDFDETAIWIDKIKKLLIVFTHNEQLLKYIKIYMGIELNLQCKPLDVGNHSFFMRDGKGVMISASNQTNTNKVTTSLMNSDMERINLIEKLLVGDYFDRILERSFSYP